MLRKLNLVKQRKKTLKEFENSSGIIKTRNSVLFLYIKGGKYQVPNRDNNEEEDVTEDETYMNKIVRSSQHNFLPFASQNGLHQHLVSARNPTRSIRCDLDLSNGRCCNGDQ